MSLLNDKAEMAQQLREWVHRRYGKWVTWRTAASAITYITECDKDGNTREPKP